MTLNRKRAAFLSLVEQLNACAHVQKTWDNQTVLKNFGITRDEALLNAIKTIELKLAELTK